MRDKALVTIAVGATYRQGWERCCLPNWRAYANAHSYDIVVITDYIDKSPFARQRSPHWQKLLILHHPDVKKYERVVWLDADIAINSLHSPCVVNHVPDPQRIGVVLAESPARIDRAVQAAVNRRQLAAGQTLNQGGVTFADVYRNIGIETTITDGFNAGVMVLSAADHRTVLEHVYTNYMERPGGWYENGALSYHLLAEGVAEGMPTAFNRNVAQLLYAHYPFLLTGELQGKEALVVRTMLENSYFLHFLGGGLSRDLLGWVPSLVSLNK